MSLRLPEWWENSNDRHCEQDLVGDRHQAVVPRPELVLTVACYGLRPLPPGLNPLCVKEAAVNRPRPVPSSSSLSPSRLGLPRVLGDDWNYTVMPRSPLD